MQGLQALPRPFHLLPPQAHPGGRTAVHVEHLSSDELGGVGGEEGDRRGDVGGVTDPAPRHQGIAELGGVAGDVEVAGDLDEAGAYGVDPDVAAGQLDGQLAGEGVDGALGRRVGRVPGEPPIAEDRGDVHDGTPACIEHEGHGPAGAEKVTLYIQVEDLVVGGLVGVQEVERAGDPGVVDEDVETA